MGDCFLDSVTSGEGEEEEDGDDGGVLTRCWGAEGTPEEEEEEDVSPADTAGPLSPSCSPVPFPFPSPGRAPSFCLAVESSCAAGL